MTRTRFKAKGRIGGENEHFARMTQSLLQHPSVTTLPHAAFRVLTILAVGACGPGLAAHHTGRNGTQAITATHARRYGLKSRETVYRSLRNLRERGLIVKTRAGYLHKRGFSLYAVGWLPITHRDGQPLDKPEPAPNAWERWEPKPRENKKATDDRAHNGQNPPICDPMPTTH